MTIGNGKYGVPKRTIFSRSFNGPIHWTLVNRTGSELVYALSGNLYGILFTGRSISGEMSQTIYATQSEWRHNRGSIPIGHTGFGYGGFIPEPSTLVLFGTGLTVIVGTTYRKRSRT
jgi:hypothetical protein